MTMSTKKTTEVTSPTKNTPNESTAKTGTKSSDTNAPKGDAANNDKTSYKPDATPKSASQISLSHFSSVSTPEYRAGWQRIFGNSKETKNMFFSSEGLDSSSFPTEALPSVSNHGSLLCIGGEGGGWPEGLTTLLNYPASENYGL